MVQGPASALATVQMRDAGKEDRRAAPRLGLVAERARAPRRGESSDAFQDRGRSAAQSFSQRRRSDCARARHDGRGASTASSERRRGSRRGQQGRHGRRDSAARTQDRRRRAQRARRASSPGARACRRDACATRRLRRATRSAEESRLPAEAGHLAAGGLALIEELQAVRRRLDALEAWRRAKKDALESAHRDNQRVGPLVRF